MVRRIAKVTIDNL